LPTSSAIQETSRVLRKAVLSKLWLMSRLILAGPLHSILYATVLLYDRGGQLYQVREPHFRRQQTAKATYSTQKKSLNQTTARFWLTNALLSLYEQL
jgi:hypothetical protein